MTRYVLCAFAPMPCKPLCRWAPGGMAAILGLDDDVVKSVCAQAADGEVVEAVNFNAPAQVVIAGHKSAVERACEAGQGPGGQARPDAARVRAFSFQPVEACRRRPGTGPGRHSIRCSRNPLINNVDVAIVSAIPLPSTMRWFARPGMPSDGWKLCRQCGRKASRMWSNAAPARCSAV